MKIVATTSLPAVDRPNADRWNAARSCQNKTVNILQRVSTTGQPMWDLVKTRHGKKHIVKAIKVSKDYGWRTVLASLTVKV